MGICAEVLNTYIDAQRQLIEFEDVDDGSCLISLPLHFSAHTRVELAITQLSENQFILTDQGQTLGELRDAGYPVGRKLLDKIPEMVRIWKVELAGFNLIRTCSRQDLGMALVELGEAAKTVGDAYVMFSGRDMDLRAEEAIKEEVRKTFEAKQYVYKEQQSVPGSIEKTGHKVDFYISPNGSNGLALEVLTNPNKLQAEAWGFRARDMKDADQRLRIGFVYDEDARDLSRTILHGIADIALPSSEFLLFPAQLEALGISRGQ